MDICLTCSHKFTHLLCSRRAVIRIVTFTGPHGPRIGILDGNDVIDLSAADPEAPTNLQEVIASGQLTDLQSIADGADKSARVSLESLELTVPIASPGKILCLGLNYKEHVDEGIFDTQPYPTIFMRSNTSMVAHGQPVVRPRNSVTLDYEAELALIVGKRARHLTPDNALEHVAGYTCSNDGSVREYQRHTIQWTMGKNFDNTGPIGPVFVTADELPPGATGLNIICRLNGQTVQSSNTDMMMFPVVETLVYLTEGLTLEPGDIVLMGTPSGVGHARDPQLWMKDGDTVEVEIENIGVLRNPVVDEK